MPLPYIPRPGSARASVRPDGEIHHAVYPSCGLVCHALLSVSVGAVCRSAQRRLVELHLSGTATSLSEQDWQQLLTGTEGLSGSDLAELTQHALYQPLRELESAASWRRLGDGQYTSLETSVNFSLLSYL